MDLFFSQGHVAELEVLVFGVCTPALFERVAVFEALVGVSSGHTGAAFVGLAAEFENHVASSWVHTVALGALDMEFGALDGT